MIILRKTKMKKFQENAVILNQTHIDEEGKRKSEKQTKKNRGRGNTKTAL